jgi:transposase-like protein
MKQYNVTLKNEAIKRILKGQSIKKVSQDLEINSSALYRWRKKYINQLTNSELFNKPRNNKLQSELTLLNIKIYS